MIQLELMSGAILFLAKSRNTKWLPDNSLNSAPLFFGKTELTIVSLFMLNLT